MFLSKGLFCPSFSNLYCSHDLWLFFSKVVGIKESFGRLGLEAPRRKEVRDDPKGGGLVCICKCFSL